MKKSGLTNTLKSVYKPKYIALNLLIGLIYYAAFYYLSYIQGGNAIMLYLPVYIIFLLVATSSILLTITIYSIKNRKRNASGAAASVGTVVLGSGLCGCTTTLLPTAALALGASITSVYVLSSFLRNYGIEITSALIVVNLVVVAYYVNKLSR